VTEEFFNSGDYFGEFDARGDVSPEDQRLLELEAAAMLATAAFRPTGKAHHCEACEVREETGEQAAHGGIMLLAAIEFAAGAWFGYLVSRALRK
jgi:hypothetical protein